MSDIYRSKTGTKVEEKIMGLVSQAVNKNAEFALWKSPGTSEIMITANISGTTINNEGTIEDLPPGFIVSPFQGEQLYLQSEFLWSSENGVVISHPEFDTDFDINSEKRLKLRTSLPLSTTPKEKYINYVKNCIETIENGKAQKIVPARLKHKNFDNINVFDLFLTLCKKYQDAFISMVSLRDYGTWIGASPELLVSTIKNKIFRTVSLAGTQLNKGYEQLKDILWSQKEIEEQAMVSRYIIDCFKKIRLREFEEIGPKTVEAGNLLHLKTIFEVDMEATNFPQLGSVMLKLLHPTSAVCGMPLEATRNYIQKHEGINRKLFAGYLGPVNIADQTSLFVNLRCLELTQDGANFYAGAGVTIDSQPEKEFNETEIKIDTLKSLL